MNNFDEWVLKDVGGSLFSLKSHEIVIDRSGEKVAQLVTSPNLPHDIDELTSIYHEIHHWICSNCNSFGYFLNLLTTIKVASGYILLNTLKHHGGIKKPAISYIKNLIDGSAFGEEIHYCLNSYTHSRKLIDVLIGLENCSISQLKSLFEESSPLFSKFYGAIQQKKGEMTGNLKEYLDNVYSNACTNNSINIEILSKDEQDFVNSIRSSEFEIKAFVDFWNAAQATFFNDDISKVNTNPPIKHHENLSWYVILEGSAKYFQEVYKNHLWAQFNIQESTNNLPIDNRSSWESWDSPYVRPMRTMLENIYGYNKQYDYDDIATFLIISDLTLNPSINDDFFLPDISNQSILDFLPGHRFIRASRCAKEFGPFKTNSIEISYEALVDSYKHYVGNLCAKLGWEPPWVQSDRWLNKYKNSANPDFFATSPFFFGCNLRIEHPLFFGLPHLAFCTELKGGWNHMLNLLPIPNFSARDTPSIFYFSKLHDHPCLVAQRTTNIQSNIIDQIFFEDGEINWDLVPGFTKKDIQIYKKACCTIFFNHGINIKDIKNC